MGPEVKASACVGLAREATAQSEKEQPQRRVVQRPPELSQLDLSGQSLQSSNGKSLGLSQDLGLSQTGLGSTLDLSASLDAGVDVQEPRTAAAADSSGKVSCHPSLKLASDIKALKRSLALLQGVRQQ